MDEIGLNSNLSGTLRQWGCTAQFTVWTFCILSQGCSSQTMDFFLWKVVEKDCAGGERKRANRDDSSNRKVVVNVLWSASLRPTVKSVLPKIYP
jgi:hypothetical protein